MYCKTFHTKPSPEGMLEFRAFVHDKYKPLISRQSGFRGASFCTTKENEFVMIMLWDEERNIHDWTDNPDHKKISAEIKHLFINEVYQDIYEVSEEIPPV